MVATLSNSEEMVFGVNGPKIIKLIDRLSRIDWFSAVGKNSDQAETERAIQHFTQCLDLAVYTIKWMTKEQAASFMDGMTLRKSPVWLRIDSIPKKIKEKAEEAGRAADLTNVIDRVPEILFHSSFTGAFREFEAYGTKVVQTAVGMVLYLFGLACAWETLGDLPGWETNPYLSLIDAFEKGHLPLGLYDDQFYIA